MMEADDSIYDNEIVLKIIEELNNKNSTEIAELVEMNYGAKPEPELQRLHSAQVIAIDSSGLRLIYNYHRWETAEQNDRMFHEHTNETTSFQRRTHGNDRTNDSKCESKLFKRF